MSRIGVALGVIGVSALLWRSIMAGTPAVIWIAAFAIVIALIAAFTVPILLRPRRLARAVRAETSAHLIASLALPGAIAVASAHGWHGRLSPRLSPVVFAVEPHGLAVWLEPGAPAFTVSRHLITLVGAGHSSGTDGQETLTIVVKEGTALMVEFGPWLALVKRDQKRLAPIATTAPQALATLGDYPQP